MGRSRAKATRGAAVAEATRKAASASEAGGSLKVASVSEAGGSLKRKAEAGERKMLRLEKEEERMIRRVKKEEERMIQRVKKEEGKILELKKKFKAAEDQAMANLPAAYRPAVKAAEPATGKRKKVVVRRVFPQEHIDALLAMPCSIIPNLLTEEQPASHPKSFQDLYNQEMDIAKKLRDYHQALIDQYSKYGYAVDELEAEVTDDEAEVTGDEDGEH